MLDRGRALQILGLPEGADETEAAVAYRELRRHVEARERAAGDEAAASARREELRDLERAWRALSSLPVPSGIVQPTRAPRAGIDAQRALLAWAVVATVVALGLGGYLLFGGRVAGPLVLVDGGGSGGAAGGGPGFAIAGEDEGGDDGEAGGDAEVLDAGPRTELVVTADVEGSRVRVRARGGDAAVVAEGEADGRSYWLSPGGYGVEVWHPDCRGDWRQDVDVAEGQPRVKLDARPCPDTAWMVVRSNVAGDELSIDGRKVGSTGERRHPVAPGEHEVRVAKDGYEPWEGIVEVEPGQVLGIRPRLVAAQKADRKPRPRKPEAADVAAAAPPQRARDETDDDGRLDHRFHEDARRWLLARYDYDRSGVLDTRDEVESISCDTWLGLEQSFDQSRLGLPLTRFYGFDGNQWRSGALGVADQTRDLAFRRMQACGLR